MTETKRTPAIRFVGFADAWEQRRLDEVATIVGGGTPSTTVPDYWDGDIDWYSPSEIGDTNYADGSIRRITEKGYLSSSAVLLPAHRTVLFTSRAGIGSMAILRRSACTNQGFQSLIVNEEICPYFVYSMGHRIKVLAEHHASGSTFLEISGKQLGRLIFAVPCPVEQQQIGAFFERLDQLIALHQRKLSKLQQLKKAMLEKMFPREGADVPEVRFADFTDAWEQRRLGEVAEFTKGSGYSKSDLVEQGTEAILYGRLYTSYQSVITEIDTFIQTRAGAVLSRGDEVLVPASGESAEDIARASALIRPNVVICGDLNIIRPLSQLRTVFLAIQLTHGLAHEAMAAMAQGKSVVHLRNSDLQSLNVHVPSAVEQQQIGLFFERLDQLIALHQRKGEKLQQMKKALLEKMFV